MFTRLLTGLAIWTIAVGCFLALSETPVPASQRATGQALPAPALTTPPTLPVRSDSPVDRQMRALEHHARVNMILYTGRFGGSEWAGASGGLGAIAVTVKAGN
jgi:hypothetical protein